MYRRLLLAALTAVLALTLGAAPPAAAVSARAAGAPAHAVLQSLLDAEHAAGMPGLYAEVRDGRRPWAGAAGVAYVDRDVPAAPWFRHRVGSVTKSFVATTVLQLVGERRLRLDTPARRYLPGLDVPEQVTVRMLLNHTSGIGNYTTALVTTEEELVEMARTTYAPEHLAKLGLGLPPTNAPGAAWSYSNTNYILLGLVIRHVTGKSFRTEITHRILRPLGMRATYFPGADPHIRGPHAGAYVPWSDGTLRDFSVFDMSWGEAAGEMISTAGDLNRFYRALFSGRLLEPALLAEMKTTVPFDPAAPEAGGYGLGVYWLPLPCGRAWGHDGGVIGQTTISWHSEDGTRQVSLGENMSSYPRPSPIDAARNAFLTEALCGSGVRAAAVPRGLLTPDVVLRR
jgi:D-alanyl-D-alanine carboxypeptidase